MVAPEIVQGRCSDFAPSLYSMGLGSSGDVRFNLAFVFEIAMCRHLPLLRELFPGKVFLDSHEIAKVLGVSHGHLLNMSMEKLIPFKLAKVHKKKIQVSILEMARYLDTKLEGESKELASVPTMVSPQRKRGRPRNGSR